MKREGNEETKRGRGEKEKRDAQFGKRTVRSVKVGTKRG